MNTSNDLLNKNGHSVDAAHSETLNQADDLIAAGDYETGISLLQKVAMEIGSGELMQRVIGLRAEAFPRMADDITLEPMYEANALLGNAEALRARLGDDGYLFFRNIVPVDKLLELRTQITDILAELGWIASGKDQLKATAISRPRREGQAKFFQAHDRIIKLEALHALAHETHLMDVMKRALGETVFPHPLCITRLVFPYAQELATPPHQDYPNNQGTPNLTAAWIPLGDCSIEDGSLAVMEGSHKFGVLPLKFHLGAGNRRAVLNDEVKACRWVGADFKAGDIVLFPAFTIHKAMENENAGSMRLSVDFRYQLEGEALTERCLQPHFDRVSWEDIYRHWTSDEFMYYWREKSYTEVPWNPSLHALPDDHAEEAYVQELAFNRVYSKRLEERGKS